MRKVGVSKGSAAPSPVPWNTSESAGGEGMKRTGSGGGGQYNITAAGLSLYFAGPSPRVASALSSRKDSPLLRNESSMPVRATESPFPKTSSVNTMITSRNLPQPQTSPRLHQATLRRSLSPANKPRRLPVESSPPLSSSSSSDSSSDSPPPHQSRLLRNRPRYIKKATQGGLDPVDSDDEEPAFMPIAHQDPSATLRGDPRHIARKTPHGHPHTASKRSQDLGVLSQTSDSSASSAPATNAGRRQMGRGLRNRPVGPLSPRRTAELAGQGKGSDGTPSMGSSFSDLDGAFFFAFRPLDLVLLSSPDKYSSALSPEMQTRANRTSRCFGYTIRSRRSSGKQHAGWGRYGKSHELDQPGAEE